MAHTENGTKRIGAETQVSYLAEVFETGAILELERVFLGITITQNLNRRSLYLNLLPLSLGRNDSAGYAEGGAGSDPL